MITKIVGALVLGVSLTVVYLYETSGTAPGSFRIFHWPAMCLTSLGPIGLILMCSDWELIRRTLDLLFTRSADRRKTLDEEAAILNRLGHEFYTMGPRSMDRLKVNHLSSYFAKTIERLALRIPTQDVRDLLERERERRESRLTQGINLLNLGVRLAPSVGMLGTILGMVHLLSSLEDPSHIGSHMGLALLTTFYGLFFSLVLWTPVQQRLERLLDVELDGFEQLSHWLELLDKRKPAQYFSDSIADRKKNIDECPTPSPA